MDERGCGWVAAVPEVVAAIVGARSAVVAIDGHSGAGKTELAGRLAEALPNARLLHLDDVYRGWQGLTRGLDHMAANVLAPLARGEAGRYRPWDWVVQTPAAWVPVAPLGRGEVLLLEGCGAFAEPCGTFVGLGIWCSAPEPVRRRRALARDDWQSADHWDEWARQEEDLTYRREPDLCWEAPA